MSVFDGMAALVVDGTSAIFGDVCKWTDPDGTLWSALVKYKDEKGSAKVGDVKYGVDNWHIEIKDSEFPGLKTLINANKKPTLTVTVRGVDTVYVGIMADALSDGLCTLITMRLKAM